MDGLLAGQTVSHVRPVILARSRLAKIRREDTPNDGGTTFHSTVSRRRWPASGHWFGKVVPRSDQRFF